MRRLLLLLIPVLVLVIPSAAQARSDQRVLFEAPRELRSDDAPLRAQTLDEIQGFGVNWLRIVLYWKDVAPRSDTPALPRFEERDPASYDWTRYDRMIAEADSRGMHILLTVSGPVPRWATKTRADNVTRPSATRFGRFTEAVAKRYGDVVDAYAIWNEPNHPDFLMPQWTGGGSHREATSAKLYRQLFQKGAAGLAAGGAGRTPVLFGETAPRGTSHVVHPITFLRTAMCLNSNWHKRASCHRLPADGYAHHAYTTRAGPYFVPPSKNDVTIGVLGRLNTALARAGEAGAVRKGLPMWLTEFGIQSFPDHVYGVSETTQAEYRAISERIAYRNPRVVSFSQYLMRDDEPIAGVSPTQRYGGFESGLRTSSSKAKVAYDAFRLPLVAIAGHSRTTLWGVVRPARAKTRVSIDYRVEGSSRWHFLKHDATDSRGSWTTTTARRSNRRYRIRWTAADGTRYAGALTRTHRSA
ncbi:MAG: cellulase family glycosylhydrolase [Conexibacter sp.]|nr:cellulase family glycosylhydrolase [Conexibacter sp.]